ncbi:MAG: antitoxin Xre-like helix-turn-helix domain-containing protein [Xenococcaceae cyanobacterium]
MVYQAVGQTLGLDSPTVSNFDLMMLTRKGVPRAAIDALANSLHLSVADLTKYLHVSERTLQRYSPDKNLSTELSDRVLQIAKVYARSLDVFEDPETTSSWLKQPIVALGNIAPIEYLDTSSGVEIVLDELTRIEYGVFS